MPKNKTVRIVLPLTVLLFFSAGSLFFWRAPSVLVTYDGKTRRIFSKAVTVGDLLATENISLGPDDFVTPSSSTILARSMPIKITRVTFREEMVTKPLKPAITWQNRTRQNLRRVLAQKGTRTEVRQKIQTIYHDGQEAEQKVLSRKRIRLPFFTLTLFNKKGFPAKKYDLLKAKAIKMLATGYYVGDPMVPGDTTFMGHKLQRGLVAVDPKIIPLGMRLYIPGYGYAYSSDTGSAIHGLRIDLAVKDAKEEKRFNHRKVTVYLLEKAPRW